MLLQSRSEPVEVTMTPILSMPFVNGRGRLEVRYADRELTLAFADDGIGECFWIVFTDVTRFSLYPASGYPAALVTLLEDTLAQLHGSDEDGTTSAGGITLRHYVYGAIDSGGVYDVIAGGYHTGGVDPVTAEWWDVDEDTPVEAEAAYGDRDE